MNPQELHEALGFPLSELFCALPGSESSPEMPQFRLGAGMGGRGALGTLGCSPWPWQGPPGYSVGLPVLVPFLGTPRAALPVSLEEQSQVLLSKDPPGGQSLGLQWDRQDYQQRGLGCQLLSVCLSDLSLCPFPGIFQ